MPRPTEEKEGRGGRRIVTRREVGTMRTWEREQRREKVARREMKKRKRQ